jgi:hypothetical protein
MYRCGAGNAEARARCPPQVLVMCGGQVAYHGPPQLALPYFSSLGLNVPLSGSSSTHTIMDIVCGGVTCAKDPLFQVRGAQWAWLHASPPGCSNSCSNSCMERFLPQGS